MNPKVVEHLASCHQSDTYDYQDIVDQMWMRFIGIDWKTLALADMMAHEVVCEYLGI